MALEAPVDQLGVDWVEVLCTLASNCDKCLLEPLALQHLSKKTLKVRIQVLVVVRLHRETTFVITGLKWRLARHFRVKLVTVVHQQLHVIDSAGLDGRLILQHHVRAV